MYFSNQVILKDFNVFLDYISINKIELTNDKMEMKAIDLLKINEKMLSFQTQFVNEKSQMATYSLLSAFFHIGKESLLFFVTANPKGNKKSIEVNIERINIYHSLTDDEKYFFLLDAFWCYVDFDSTYNCRKFTDTQFYIKVLSASIDVPISIEERNLKRTGDIRRPIYLFALEVFSAFGFYKIQWDKTLLKRPDKYSCGYYEITPSAIGQMMCLPLFKERRHSVWLPEKDRGFDFIYELSLNEDEQQFDEDEENENNEKGNFEDAFLENLPDLQIKNRLLPIEIPMISGQYLFKVSLEKDLYRTISISGNHDFEDLHIAIQDAFDFGDDHLYAFFIENKRNGKAYYAPYCEEEISVDEVKIGQSNLFKGHKFYYIFDFGSTWRFDIIVVDILTEVKEKKEYFIVESKGENPEQYEDYDENE